MGALVASPESPPLPVRVLAATEGDLQAEVQAGRFRQDLFQRLSGLRLTLPALRARRADVALLARAFLRRVAERENTPLELSPAALEALSAYDWPGNVRELKSAITRLAVLAQHQPITAQDVQEFALRSGRPAVGALPTLRIDELEQQALVLALELTGSDKKAAAEQLGVSLRTLYNMLERYDLKGRFVRH
jgi:DNA-binding NtrC family response regulator